MKKKKYFYILAVFLIITAAGATTFSLLYNQHKKPNDEKTKNAISEISLALNSILESRIDSAWTKTELQKIVDEKIGIGEVTVNIISNLTSSSIKGGSETVTFLGNGTIRNDFKYNGQYKTIHKWTKEEDTTKDISTIKDSLQKILNSETYKYKALTASELQTEVDKKYSDGGIRVVLMPTKSSSFGYSSTDTQNQTFKFTGLGEIDNNYKYKGTTNIERTWQNDTTKDISTIKDSLQKILNSETYKYKVWTASELQTEIDKISDYKGITVSKKSSLTSHEDTSMLETFTFTSDGGKENSYKYSGTIDLVHNWTKVEDTSKNISEVKDVLNAFVNNTDTYTTSLNLEDLNKEVESKFGTGEIVISKKEISDTKVEFTFTGQGTAGNDFIYSGSITISHSFTTIADNQTGYIDVKTGEPKAISGSAPSPTKEVFQIGYDADGKAYTIPTTVTTISVKKISNNIRSFKELFSQCSSLEEVDLSSWDMSSINSMESMFLSCKNLKKVITNKDQWKIDNVTTMKNMFYYCTSLESIDISSWNVSNQKLTDTAQMFAYCENLKSIGEITPTCYFDTTSVTNMDYMFWRCTSLEGLNLSGFCTKNVTEAQGMFKTCTSLKSITINVDSGYWSFANATDVSYMFFNCGVLKLDCSNWQTGIGCDKDCFNTNAPSVIAPK